MRYVHQRKQFTNDIGRLLRSVRGEALVRKGSKDVLEYLEQVFDANSSEQGFTAKPIFTVDSEGNRKKAVALFSKLEDYISWLFRICSSIETWKIVSIIAERPDGYDMYYDSYIEGNYDDDGNAVSL